jgi:serine phosphatase RsbU (regulator of sigma subunit)
MAKAKTRPTLGAGLLRILWRTPLFAVPFALFFALLEGGFKDIGTFYILALIFAYANALGAFGVGMFLDARRSRAEARVDVASGRSALAGEITLFMAAAIVASALAAAVIHFTLLPSFLSKPQQVVQMLVFSLLFCALFLGISYATHFYGEALARARSEEELNLARRIQRSFLLSSFPQRSGLEVHALNVSSKQVSGDFYDVVPAEGGFLLCIADVSGKGVPAALLSSMLQASLRTQAPLLQPVGAMISNVNGMLCQGVANGQFATMFLARIDETRMTLQYVNAGHNPPILVHADGRRELLEAGGPMVGSFEAAAFEQAEVALAPGDRIVLYTDGVSEAMNARMEMYGDDRVGDLAASLPGGDSAAQTIDSILGALRGFLAGEEPQDDMTLMVVKVLGQGGPVSSAAHAAPQLVAVPAELVAPQPRTP